MHLRHAEEIIRIIKRHKTPYVFKLLKIFLIIIPLYILLFSLRDQLNIEWMLILFSVLSFFLGIILGLVSLDYLLDKIIITNKRIVWVNWLSLFKKEEHEAELIDVHDVGIRERGILSKLSLFNYGMLDIKTYASKTIISFGDCPHPESVGHFIIVQAEKARGAIPSS